MAMMYAVLLSLGVVMILTWLAKMFGESAREDGLIVSWAVMLLLGHFQLWWTVVAFAEVETWNYFTYLYLLSGPGALFVATSILLGPSAESMPCEGGFESIRRKFSIALLIVLAWSLFTSPVLDSDVGSDTFLNLVFAGVVAGLVFAGQRRHQVWLTAASAVLLFISIIGYGFWIEP